jgi:hypothetical protein
MSLIRRSPEKVAAKGSHQGEDLAAKERAEFEYTWRGFWESPPGVARRTFKNGDHVFQYSLDVLNQSAIMTALVGSSTRIVKLDPSAVLDAVCREGWELVNGSFVLVRSGDTISSRETLMGYYLLKRCEENREPETEEELARRLGWSPEPPERSAEKTHAALQPSNGHTSETLERSDDDVEAPDPSGEAAETLDRSGADDAEILDQTNGGAAEPPRPPDDRIAETAARSGDDVAVSCPDCGATFANLEAYFAHYQSRHKSTSVV